MRQGLFISFEGGEGGGKSTQIRKLKTALRRRGHSVLQTLEPGGSGIGKKIRELLLNPKNKHLSNRAELLLYLADRAQHVDEVILPALRAGRTVITDRYADSSTVYQGICRALGLEWTETLNTFATEDLYPDLVIVLDVPESIGLSRIKRRFQTDVKLTGKRRVVKLDRLEREKASFHRKVRQGFLQLAKRHPERIRVIDGTQNPDAVSADILAVLDALPRRGKR